MLCVKALSYGVYMSMLPFNPHFSVRSALNSNPLPKQPINNLKNAVYHELRANFKNKLFTSLLIYTSHTKGLGPNGLCLS